MFSAEEQKVPDEIAVERKLEECQREVEALAGKLAELCSKESSSLSYWTSQREAAMDQTDQERQYFAAASSARSIRSELKFMKYGCDVTHIRRIREISLSGVDANLLAVLASGKVRICDGYSGSKVMDLRVADPDTRQVRISEDGKVVATSVSTKHIHVFHLDEYEGMGPHPHSSELISDGEVITTMDMMDGQGSKLISGDMGLEITQWDLTKECRINSSMYPSFIRSMKFNLKTGLLVTGSGNGRIKIWDPRMEKHVCGFRTQRISTITAVSWFPDGSAVMAGDSEGRVHLMDMRSNKQVNCYQTSRVIGNPVSGVDVSHTGKYMIAAYNANNPPVLYDTLTGYKKQDISLDNPMHTALFAWDDSNTVITGSNRQVLFFC